MMSLSRPVSMVPPNVRWQGNSQPLIVSILSRGKRCATKVPTFVSKGQCIFRFSTYRASTILVNRVGGSLDNWFHHPTKSLQQRHFSSNRDRDFQLDALPFSIPPEQALQSFQNWAVNEQGLNHLIRWQSVRIGASYLPVWSFDVNIRFVTSSEGKKKYDWKPEIFAEAYGNQPVIYVSGLSTYSGYTYRRSLVNPIVNTTLVFMGDKTTPFEKYMLKDIKLPNGDRIHIFPDPWNATQGRAFGILRDDLEDLAKEAPAGGAQVQTEVLGARRVYMPMYVIEYSVLGAEYTAFVSGCDAGAGVSGVSHTVLNQDVSKASNTFLSNASQFGMRMLNHRHIVGRLVVLLQLFGNVFARVLARLPLIGVIGGAFVGFRKLIRPWMDNRWASAAWEREREHESIESEYPERADDFVDNGSAKRYYQKNKEEILRHLSGETAHEEGGNDWYKEWEEWARKQYERQQQQPYGQQYGYNQQQQQQQQYQRQQQQQKKATPEYKWDFDPNDPYSVLRIKRGATKKEVSEAFRREMLKHHPDTQAGASEAAKERSTERSKLISDAYRKIKAEMK